MPISWHGGNGDKEDRRNFHRRRLPLLPVLVQCRGCNTVLQQLNINFHRQFAFMLSFLEVVTQVAASHHGFSCNKMVNHQSSILAGNSGDSSRQLRQGGGGGDRLLTVGQLAGALLWKYSSGLCMGLDSKFCDFLSCFLYYLALFVLIVYVIGPVCGYFVIFSLTLFVFTTLNCVIFLSTDALAVSPNCPFKNTCICVLYFNHTLPYSAPPPPSWV
jgi:hypothetical protein